MSQVAKCHYLTYHLELLVRLGGFKVVKEVVGVYNSSQVSIG